MNNLQQILGYDFKDKNLLKVALTHISFAHDNNCESYERLEYVGDALADFIVGEYLYKNFDLDAGELSKYRAKLVSTSTFASIIAQNQIDKYILTGKSVQKVSDSIRADIFESILASIYFDGGMDKAKAFVNRMLLKSKHCVLTFVKEHIDYKTTLQEKLQSYIPQKSMRFEVISQEGKDDDKNFTVALFVDNVRVASTTGKSHKMCEQECAKIALSKF